MFWLLYFKDSAEGIYMEKLRNEINNALREVAAGNPAAEILNRVFIEIGASSRNRSRPVKELIANAIRLKMLIEKTTGDQVRLAYRYASGGTNEIAVWFLSFAAKTSVKVWPHLFEWEKYGFFDEPIFVLYQDVHGQNFLWKLPEELTSGKSITSLLKAA